MHCSASGLEGDALQCIRPRGRCTEMHLAWRSLGWREMPILRTQKYRKLGFKVESFNIFQSLKTGILEDPVKERHL